MRLKIEISLLICFFAAFLWLPQANAQEAVKLVRHPYRIEVVIGGKPFTTYYFSSKEAKPYLQPLRTAGGIIVTRGFPIGNYIPPAHRHDRSIEPHQRPMYFAHGDIDGYTFWSEQVFAKEFYPHERDKYGRTVFEKLETVKSGPHSSEIRALFNLVGGGRVLAEETQDYVFRGGPNTRTIDCQFVIKADHGPVRMGDTKEGTFAIRVTKSLDSPPGHMVNSNGGVGESQIWGKRADWVDYYGKVDGKEVGIAIFDSPRSFRHPTYWHARAYGLFAANPFGIREFTHDPNQNGSYTIPAGKSLLFQYRVLIHRGDYKQAHIAKAYQEYAAEER
ncbi:MAG: PmoA family protein [Terriglobia bacterium]